MQSSNIRYLRWLLAFSAVSLIVYVGGFLHGRFTSGWGPFEKYFAASEADEDHAGHDHSAHDHGAHDHGLDQPLSAQKSHGHADEPTGDSHGHAEDEHAHGSSSVLEVSETARKNLGLDRRIFKAHRIAIVHSYAFGAFDHS